MTKSISRLNGTDSIGNMGAQVYPDNFREQDLRSGEYEIRDGYNLRYVVISDKGDRHEVSFSQMQTIQANWFQHCIEQVHG